MEEMIRCAIGLSVAGAVLWLSAAAHGSVIAAWNMNGINPSLDPFVAASTGKGLLDVGGLGSAASVLAGTTLGAQTGEIAGDCLAAIGTAANATSMRFDFQTVGYRDLTVSFATRRSATGAAMNRLEYWAGFTWVTALEFASNATNWELVTIDLSSVSGLNDSSVSMRFVIDGATGSTGSLRVDNFSVSGNAVPAPGALALVGLAGCAARRRRR
jgi:MYXO-CTERM domain-containing protein